MTGNTLIEILRLIVPIKIEEAVDLRDKNVGHAIIDPVHGFCTVGAGNLAPRAADPRIELAIDTNDGLARRVLSRRKEGNKKKGRVFVQRDVHRKDTPEHPYLPHCELGSGEEELVEKLQWLIDHLDVTHAVKTCINAILGDMRFGGGNNMVEWITIEQIQALIIGGFCTEICPMEYAQAIMSIWNLRQLPMLEQVIVIPDGCATYDLPFEVAVGMGKPEASHPADVFHHIGLTLMQKSGVVLAKDVIL